MASGIQQKPFPIFVLASPLERGQAALHPTDLLKLGGTSNGDNYIQVANRIYQVVANEGLEKGFLALHTHQYVDALSEHAVFYYRGADRIGVQIYHPNEFEQKVLSTIVIDVYSEEKNSPEIDLPLVFAPSKVNKIAKKYLVNNYFAYGQEFPIFTDEYKLRFKVFSMSSNSSSSQIGTPFYGLVNEKTKVILNSTDPDDMVFLRDTIIDPKVHITFNVTSLFNVLKTRKEGYPKLIDSNQLRTVAERALSKILLHTFSNVVIKDSSIGEYHLSVDSFSSPKLDDAESYGYYYSPGQMVTFQTESSDISFISGRPQETKNIGISLVQAVKLDREDHVTEEEADLVDLSALSRAIKLIKDGFILNQMQSVKLPGVQVRLKFIAISGASSSSQHWILAQNGTITVESDPSFKIPLVNNQVLQDISEAYYTVRPKPESGLVVIDEETVKKRIQQVVRRQLRGSSFVLPEDPVLFCQATFMRSAQDPVTTRFIGKMTDKTVIKVNSSSQSLKIITPLPTRFIQNPHEVLEELEIGGVPDECIEYLKMMILSKTKSKKNLIAAGIKPPKGVLLAGPPGTGKTILADKLGVILGIPKTNITVVRGPELYRSLVGEGEEALRNHFAKAIEAWNSYGNISDYFLIIFEEADAIFGIRNHGHNLSGALLVNQFISIMDGIDSPQNIIVVATTNQPEIIDRAVTRPGRLNPVINMPKPNKKGRMAIFKIRTKELQELNLLDDKIKMCTLADKTENMTGADIAKIVQEAVLKLEIEKSLQNDPTLKLKMAHFEYAIDKIKLQFQQNEPPFMMYI